MQIHSAGISNVYGNRFANDRAPAESAVSAQRNPAKATGTDDADVDGQTTVDDRDGAGQSAASTRSSLALTADEQYEVQLLKQRDQEVRAHELAHVAAGGRYVTSAPSYDFQSGPDGRSYAIGGEVGIDTSAIAGDPGATLEKARTLARAALAPAEPSSQDQRVAAAAKTMEVEALRELSIQGAHAATAGEAKTSGSASETVDQTAETISGTGDGQQSSQVESADRASQRDRLAQRIEDLFTSGTGTRFSLHA
jgi:hypothetical protein